MAKKNMGKLAPDVVRVWLRPTSARTKLDFSAMAPYFNKEKGELEIRGKGEIDLGIKLDELIKFNYKFETSPIEIITKIKTPIYKLVVYTPVEYATKVIIDLANMGATVVKCHDVRGEMWQLRVKIPVANMIGYVGKLRKMTNNRGTYRAAFKKWR